MHRSTRFTTCFFAAFTTAAMAAPLDPAHVPQDAKWVLHLDYEALSETQLLEQLRQQRPEIVKHARSWLQERYGIDPREDLQGVTLFSDTYDAHTGAIVLLADYDLEKVKDDLMSKPGVKVTQWQEATLYTWTADKPARGAHREDSGAEERDAEASGERNREPPREQQEQAQEMKREGATITAVLLDGEKAVFASSPERAKSVVQLLEGETPSLEGETSKLTAEIPEGAFFYGAAVNLQAIARRDELFPILQQHEHIKWAIGQRDERLFEDVTLVAEDEEVAREMKTALEGFVALARVWASDMEGLAPLYEELEIAQEGRTVTAKWQGETQEVLAAFQVLKERLGKRIEDRRDEATRR